MTKTRAASKKNLKKTSLTMILMKLVELGGWESKLDCQHPMISLQFKLLLKIGEIGRVTRRETQGIMVVGSSPNHDQHQVSLAVLNEGFMLEFEGYWG